MAHDSRDPGAIRRAKERRRRLTYLLFIAVVVVLVGGAGALRARNGNNGEKKEEEGVETAAVKRVDLSQKISATGIIAAQTGAQVRIGSQITGRIRRLSADIGSRVSAGQVIAELDLPDVRAQLEQGERAFAQARARHEEEVFGLNMERVSSDAQLSEALEALNGARIKLAQTRATAEHAPEQTTAEIRRAEEALKGAETRLRQGQNEARLQPTQTRSQIQRAAAELSTARSSLVQAEKGSSLQITAARAALKQAEATHTNARARYRRAQDLAKQGFASQRDVDDARTEEEVAAAGVESSQESLKLVQEKVTADLQAAKDRVTQAQAQLDAAESNQLLDEIKLEEVKNLEALLRQASASLVVAKVGVYLDDIKRQEVENVQAQVRQAEAAAAAARANLDRTTLKRKRIQQAMEAMREAQARVDYHKAQWQKTFIRTPISGTVLQLAQQEGETVAAGLSAPTLIEVADLNRLEDTAYVDETDIGRVRLGQKAEITVDAYPDQPFTGRVVKVASGPTMQENVVTYMTTIAIDDPGGKLKPGMTTTTTIFVGERKGVLAVPSEAIKKEESGSVAFVWKPGMAKPEKRALKIGAADGNNVEVLDGVKEGETVITAGLGKLGVEGYTQDTPSFFKRMANPFAGGDEKKKK